MARLRDRTQPAPALITVILLLVLTPFTSILTASAKSNLQGDQRLTAAERPAKCGVGRFEWGSTCRTCAELKCSQAGCKDGTGCTACPAGSFIAHSVNGIQHCRACKDNGCSEDACKDKLGCSSCASGFVLIQRQQPETGEQTQACVPLAKLGCAVGKSLSGCSQCPLESGNKSAPSHFLAPSTGPTHSEGTKQCRSCSASSCAPGGCQDDVGCTGCGFGHMLVKDPLDRLARSPGTRNCTACAKLGCRANDCDPEKGCLACPAHHYLFFRPDLGTTVCMPCSEIHCEKGGCQDYHGCTACESRKDQYITWNQDPDHQVWRCITCIDAFNCSKCPSNHFISTFNGTDKIVYCNKCDDYHCRNDEPEICRSRYSKEEVAWKGDVTLRPREAMQLSGVGCSQCMDNFFGQQRLGVWDCRILVSHANCIRGLHTTILNRTSGCRGCPIGHYPEFDAMLTRSYRPFSKGIGHFAEWIQCERKCSELHCTDCDREYRDVVAQDKSFETVKCYGCESGYKLTEAGRCVKDCPTRGEVMIADGSCRPGCREGYIMSADGDCHAPCATGKRWFHKDQACKPESPPPQVPYPDEQLLFY
ncbi:hypothetical protein WJX74_008053 [Apatococcus lobatus]|uniref:Uncharacterized protein n=1 Tax=Apatococcus lobatus TaxID=904363 RepID=A0AAW1RSW5_9CHLO